MTSYLYQHAILATLVACGALTAGAGEPSATPVKDKIGLDRWTYIHADDSRAPAAGGRAGDFGIGFGDVNGDGDLGIVSIAYFGFKDLHVWRNDNGVK